MRSGYDFSLREEFMYVKILVCRTPTCTMEVEVEQSPYQREGLLLWENDFGDPGEARDLLLKEFGAWATKRGIRYTIRRNASRA